MALKRRNIMVSAFFLLNEKIVPGTIFSFFEKKSARHLYFSFTICWDRKYRVFF